jgi:sugar-specific transcriptional regulator TrmB
MQKPLSAAQSSGDELVDKLVAELRSLDLAQNEARILVSLMSSGPSIASDVSRNTGIQRTEVYQTLYSLQSKGIVFSTFEKPQRYYALAIADVFDALIQIKQNALRELSRRKGRCTQLFEEIMASRVSPKVPDRENYQVITGMDAIGVKVTKMVAEAKREVLILVSEKNLLAFHRMDVVDRLRSLPEHVRLVVKVMGWKDRDYLYKDIMLDGVVKVEKAFTCDFVGGSPMPLNMVIVDRSEVLIIPEDADERREYGFYASTRSLASTFAILHESIK